MPITRRHCAALLLFAPWSIAGTAADDAEASVSFEGLRFARRVTVAGVPLLLNGTGLRAVAWFKGFAAALYLPQRTAVPAQAVAMAGPKRLQLRMLHDVPAAEFAKAFRKGVGRNAGADEMPRLSERMQRFESLVQTLGTVAQGRHGGSGPRSCARAALQPEWHTARRTAAGR